MKLTELQVDCLSGVVAYCASFDDVWARPMDVGGTDGSSHGPCLFRLSERGLLERKTYKWSGGRRVNKYRPNDQTSAALAAAK